MNNNNSLKLIRKIKINNLVVVDNPNFLKKIFEDKIHQTLRKKFGVIENKAFQIILNLLLTKIYDELESINNPNRSLEFQVTQKDLLNKRDFYNKLNNLYQNAITKLLLYDLKHMQTRNIIEHHKKEDILINIVPYLQQIKLSSVQFLKSDSMGDFFLDFMHTIFRQSRGLFFTHPNICRFICKAINIEKIRTDIKNNKYKKIIDPSCGSGTFLVEAFKLIFNNNNNNDIKDLSQKILYGIDNNIDATTLCKINIIIHGGSPAKIFTQDALVPLNNIYFLSNNNIVQTTNKFCTTEIVKNEFSFDYLITNPPFSIEINRSDCLHFIINKFIHPINKITTKASECYFIERWFQLLKTGGRVGAILPFSLFDSKEYFSIRLLFLSYFRIIAVLSLPEHTFSPYAQQKTLLVFARKRKLQDCIKLFKNINYINQFIDILKNEKIFFYNIKNIGFIRTKKQNKIKTTNINNNDLSSSLASIISNLFENNDINNVNFGQIFSIKEIFDYNNNLILTPNIQISNFLSDQTFILKDWELVNIDTNINININSKKLFLCETGDITRGGSGIIIPKNLKLTTVANRERIIKKIKNKKFGRLKEGDIIIAPVRVYQKKIAIITKNATNFYFSKDFIILRRKDNNINLIDSLKIFYTLIQDKNISLLFSISTIGKSGYPKIKDKKEKLKIKFYKVNILPEKLESLKNLYDQIYKDLFLEL